MYQFIQYEVTDRIAYITLNRPDKRNALNEQVVAELKQAAVQAEQSADVKVIVLRGNGPAFCAGADLAYLQNLQNFSMEDNVKDSVSLGELFLLIYRSSKPYIAQIEGHAIAGGCGLATICDFSFSVPEAKFGYTEVRIGFVPAIVMFFLLRKIGETRGKELLLSGELISAEKACAYNMVNHIASKDSIAQEVKDFANKLCEKNSATSMQLTKKMIADIQGFPVEDAVRFAAKMNAHARSTPDCQRGIAAFLSKEKITW